jgi:hypothetical protein
MRVLSGIKLLGVAYAAVAVFIVFLILFTDTRRDIDGSKSASKSTRETRHVPDEP